VIIFIGRLVCHWHEDIWREKNFSQTSLIFLSGGVCSLLIKVIPGGCSATMAKLECLEKNG